MHIP
jgi:hypothetical protein